MSYQEIGIHRAADIRLARRLGGMRVCFLFNHDQIHQIAHSLPTALALAESGIDAEIIVATTNALLTQEVQRLIPRAAAPNLKLVQLSVTNKLTRALSDTLDWIIPARKILVYRDNLDFFRSLDVLVVAEKTSLVLKSRYGLDRLKIVHTRHGAGDRAIGFDRASASFDHVLVSGPKIAERLIEDAGVSPDRISIVGYPKFDLHEDETPPVLFGNGKPTVLYNPHPSPHLSSWYDCGREVLDWFADQDDYNLIFAPHIMLFQRKFVASVDKWRFAMPGRIDNRYLRAPNIHVDLGSRASTTMAYTTMADIYIGDVSSQVYEFIRYPRPCVFINAFGVEFERDPNYAHWTAGPVIEDVAHLDAALHTAITRHESYYRPIQEKLFAERFSLTDEPSSRRAARAIAHVGGMELPSDINSSQRLVG